MDIMKWKLVPQEPTNEMIDAAIDTTSIMNTVVFRWRLYNDNPSLLEKMRELNIIREEIKKIMIASYNQGLHDKYIQNK